MRVVDMRWLHPLPEAAIVNAVADCEKILIVDECRRTGSVSEALITLLVEHNIHLPISRITAEDCFIPLGDAANLVLPSVESIRQHIVTFLQAPSNNNIKNNINNNGKNKSKSKNKPAAVAATLTRARS
ncbi:MAG: 2-oxoisovalerate dehydrogenase E1 component [Lentisphaeria bacterium]